MSEVTQKVKVNATIMWAFLNKIKDGNTKHSVDLCNLSDAAVDALEAMDIEVKRNAEKPELGYFITCYSKNPIRAIDEDGTPIPTDVLVGNGSKATVIISPYQWTYLKKKGTSPTIRKLIITDLKVYQPSDSDDDTPAL